MASMCFVLGSMLPCATTKNFGVCKPLCSSPSTSNLVTVAESLVRRSADYGSSLWSYDHIQSLSSKYKGEDYTARTDALKGAIKILICIEENPLNTFQLVDNIQRLGISYHFEKEISNALDRIYNDCYKTQDKWNGMDLNLKALGFRLLRQHGYHVPQEILHNFESETHNLKPQLYGAMLGMLNLYEATYHSFEDESILDDARDFTNKYLKENLQNIDRSILPLVSHALEFPLHWRVARVEAIWFIHVYEKRSDANPTLIELAKLDFNIAQAIHLEDLKYSSSWWRNTCWDQKLSFARDRLVENFMWTIGVGYQPYFSLERRMITKILAIIATVDDVYDVYGTIDELEQFTDVINRWDINAIEELPDYMKICLLGSYNSINEIVYNKLTSTGFFGLPYLKKAWAGLCKSYLVEAQWYHSGHMPTLKEYLDNAWVSISGPVILTHVHFFTSVTSTEEILQYMEQATNIVRYASLILRLADDLGTSSDEMARGDNPKSIQCYMHETGATEDEARSYMKGLIIKTWKKLNKERANSRFSREFVDIATNMARMAQFMYRKGDGLGRPDVSKSHVLSLLFNPIQGV